MLHKQAKKYLLIPKSAEISPCEIRSLLDYDRGQCAESSYLKDDVSHASPYEINGYSTVDVSRQTSDFCLKAFDLSNKTVRASVNLNTK